MSAIECCGCDCELVRGLKPFRIREIGNDKKMTEHWALLWNASIVGVCIEYIPWWGSFRWFFGHKFPISTEILIFKLLLTDLLHRIAICIDFLHPVLFIYSWPRPSPFTCHQIDVFPSRKSYANTEYRTIRMNDTCWTHLHHTVGHIRTIGKHLKTNLDSRDSGFFCVSSVWEYLFIRTHMNFS